MIKYLLQRVAETYDEGDCVRETYAYNLLEEDEELLQYKKRPDIKVFKVTLTEIPHTGVEKIIKSVEESLAGAEAERQFALNKLTPKEKAILGLL